MELYLHSSLQFRRDASVDTEIHLTHSVDGYLDIDTRSTSGVACINEATCNFVTYVLYESVGFCVCPGIRRENVDAITNEVPAEYIGIQLQNVGVWEDIVFNGKTFI